MIARPPLAVPLVALTCFVVLLGLVVSGWPPLERIDAAISAAFREYGESRPGLIHALRIITDTAATVPFVSVGIAAFLLLRRAGDRLEAALCGALTLVVPALWILMHLLVPRTRPLDGFVTVDSNGFPSGHTTMATSAALVAVLLLWPRLRPGRRVLIASLAVGFAFCIGVTRVALLAHWPTDVLGGWLLALAVVSLAARAIGRTVALAAPTLPSRDR